MPVFDSMSRRNWLWTVGAVGVGAMKPLGTSIAADPRRTPASPRPLAVATRHAAGDIVELYSTTDVFIPPRGRSFMKFSFDFPEPAVVFGDHRFSFLVFTDENTYALDRTRMVSQDTVGGNAIELTCDQFVWAGGQEAVPGSPRRTGTSRRSRARDRQATRRVGCSSR